MKRNAVLVDVSIDQGGCFETSRPTTHSDPTFEVDGITHYCVTNMPGAVPITSTYALTNATLPYVIELAERGVDEALERSPGLRMGLNVQDGRDHPSRGRRGARPRPRRSTETTITLEKERRHGEHDRDPEQLHRRRACRVRWRDRSGAQPSHRRGACAGAALRRGGRRARGAGRAAGVRRLVAHHAGTALAGAARARRPDRGARR